MIPQVMRRKRPVLVTSMITRLTQASIMTRMHLILVGFVTALTLLSPRSVSAATFSEPAVTMASACAREGPLKWWGGEPQMSSPLKEFPEGTVSMCWRKYRLTDQDTSGDYYAVVAISTWTSKQGDFEDFPAAMYQDISSDVDAISQDYDATATVTSDKDCSIPIEVSLAYRAVSVGTELKMCKGGKIKRYKLSTRGAGWFSENAGRLRQVETVFVQKVPEGANPHFTVSFGIPQYDNQWNDGKGQWISNSHLVWQSFTDAPESADQGGGQGGGQGAEPVHQKWWVDTSADAEGYSSPGGTRTGTLKAGTNYVYCKKQGPKIQKGSSYNSWWLLTDLDSGKPTHDQWVSAYYLSRWGNDEAKDNNGKDIPDCP